MSNSGGTLTIQPLDRALGWPELGSCLQVLDSPFGRLKDLMVELCEEQKLPIPRAFMRIALSMMRRSVRKRANFNVDDVSPLDVVPGSFIPALFGEDDFTKHLLCDCMQFAHAHCVCQYSSGKAACRRPLLH